MSEVLIYEIETGKPGVDVRLDGETVWLSREQMAQLFERDRSVITKHLGNIFRDGELDPSATCAKFAQVQTEGGRTLTHDSVVANFATTTADGKTYRVEYFNLDVIISVGYRVHSKRGVQFRQWATRVLREHLVEGFTINQSRIAEQGISEMQAAIELLSRTLESRALVTSRNSKAPFPGFQRSRFAEFPGTAPRCSLPGRAATSAAARCR